MSIECSVLGCKSNEHTKSIFEYDQEMPAGWSEILKSKKSDNPITICEDHFTKDDILVNENGWKEIIPGSKPSVLKIDMEVCRLCLKTIEDEEKTTINYSVKSAYYNLLGVGMEDNKHFPHQCCQKCIKDLKLAAYTKKKFLENALGLQKLNQIIRESESHNIFQNPYKLEHEDIKTECEDYFDEMNAHDFLDINDDNASNDQNDQEDHLDLLSNQITESLEIMKMEKHRSSLSDTLGSPKTPRKSYENLSKYHDFTSSGKVPKKRGRKPKGSSENLSFEHVTVKPDKSKNNSPKLLHPCLLCPKKFTTQLAAKNHTDRIHFRIKKIICDLCGFRNFTKSDLMRHMSKKHIHMNLRQKFPCTMCDKEFLDKTTLNSHFRFIHLNEVHGVCEYCGTSFQSDYKYKEHMRVKHTNDKPFKCQECPYVCATSRELYYHRASIHRTDTLVCQYCSKKFHNKKTMEGHIRMNHREKKYVCEYEGCQMRFSVNNLLKKHMNSHLKLKLFQCDECENRYSSYTHAYVHIVSTHIKYHFTCMAPGCSAYYHRKDFLQSHIRVNHAYLGEEIINQFMEKIRSIKVDLNGYTITKLD